MDDAKKDSDPAAELVEELCPNLSGKQKQEARDNLLKYIALVARIVEREERENGDNLDSKDIPSHS